MIGLSVVPFKGKVEGRSVYCSSVHFNYLKQSQTLDHKNTLEEMLVQLHAYLLESNKSWISLSASRVSSEPTDFRGMKVEPLDEEEFQKVRLALESVINERGLAE